MPSPGRARDCSELTQQRRRQRGTREQDPTRCSGDSTQNSGQQRQPDPSRVSCGAPPKRLCEHQPHMRQCKGHHPETRDSRCLGAALEDGNNAALLRCLTPPSGFLRHPLALAGGTRKRRDFLQQALRSARFPGCKQGLLALTSTPLACG